MAKSIFRLSAALLAGTAVAAALLLAAFGFAGMDAAYFAANSEALAASSRALAALVPADLQDAAGAAAWCALAARAGEAGGGALRVTLVLPDGRVLADSAAEPAAMEGHGGRPEIAAALAGSVGTARRRSATLGRELVYAAAPVERGGRVVSALRLALEVPVLGARLEPARWAIAIAVALLAAAIALAARAFSRSLARPIARLAERARSYASDAADAAGAARFRTGSVELGRSGLESAPEELKLLGASLDSMAEELALRIAAAEAQGRELEAVLASMAEAVLALDAELRLRLANSAARELFRLPEPFAPGARLLEATRSTEIQAAAEACLASGERQSAELALYTPAERWIRVLAAPLGLSRGRAPGAGFDGVVLVLGDITELRRLERVRKDFVANVSHELRTPIQIVKGFAESLRGMSSRDAKADPERAARFLGIIERNAERMERLINDLLALAALERDGATRLGLERSAIAPILAAALEAVAPKAEAKGMELRLECPPELEAEVEPGLLEQAIVNLVDNAVKYSPPGTPVLASARAEGGEFVLEVRDRGMGIPAKDLGRLFERFYRVDKARSRELGGTGLGLAIVKHIALAHGGSAEVESWEGEGSTFRLRLPLHSA